MDTHAALQSEQDFHLTARVNPGLFDIFPVMFQSFKTLPHGPPRATVCFPFEEKRGRIIHVGRRKLGNRSGLILVYKYRRLSLVHICCALCDGHISAHGDTLLL